MSCDYGDVLLVGSRWRISRELLTRYAVCKRFLVYEELSQKCERKDLLIFIIFHFSIEDKMSDIKLLKW